MSEYEENLSELASDSIDAEIPKLNPAIQAYLEARRAALPDPALESIGEAHIEENHRLVIPGLPIEHIYELEPRTINGDRYFEFGISATRNKQDPVAFILHHTSDAQFENMMNYIIRRDPAKGGTFGYHFLIGRDGRAVQAAPLNKRTNHVSPTANRTAQHHMNNTNTLSLSLHGGYRKTDQGTEHVPASDEQLSVAEKILSTVASLTNVDIKNTWGHGEVQSNRMSDEALELSTRLRGTIMFA